MLLRSRRLHLLAPRAVNLPSLPFFARARYCHGCSPRTAAADDRPVSRQASNAPPVQTGQEIELKCTRFGVGRKGVCLVPPTDFVVLCDRALPGERLLAKITDVKKGFASAEKLQVLEPHDNAVEALCPHFGPCGGCSYQNLAYAAQLVAKQDQVAQQMRRVGKVADVEAVMRPIVGCKATYAYRNKMTFTFSPYVWDPPGAAAVFQLQPAAAGAPPQPSQLASKPAQSSARRAQKGGSKPGRGGRGPSRRGGGGGLPSIPSSRFAVGLYKPGSNDVVLPVALCALQSDAANEVLVAVRRVAQEVQPSVYDPQTGKGLFRQCVVRRGTDPVTGGEELMVMLLLRQHDPQALQPFVDALQQLPAVVSIYSAVAPSPGPPQGAIRQTHLLAGQPRIRESVCGLSFDISPLSFFQTNTRQTEVLYQKVAEAAGLREGCQDVVLDLYCGTGTIGLSLAARCKKVHGVEIVGSAVKDAQLNAERNGISNATFEKADLSKEGVGRELFGGLRPDVVVLDPARGGLEGDDIVRLLTGSGARRLVYVSCNASTQARDIDRLCHQEGSVYRLLSLQPVDMFPHTDHVESVAVLERIGADAC